MVALFWNLTLALVLARHCYCGDNIKYELFSKHLLQRKRQYGSEKSHGNDKLLEKITSSVITWTKKHSSTQVASITYTLKKKNFCSCYF